MVASSSLALLCALFGANGESVLLDFTATWCGPCRMVAPTVDRLAASGYPVRKVDIDQHPELAERFQVRGVPCFVMLVNGQEVDRVVGPASYDRLAQMCERGRSGATTSPPTDPRATFATTPTAGGSGFGRGSSLTAEAATGGPPATTPAYGPAPSAAAPRGRPAHLSGGAFEARSSAAPPSGFAMPPSAAQPFRPEPAIESSPVRETTTRDVYASVPPTERAMAATVKLEVEDPKGMSFGTGTIIDQRGADALIITCGHLFRDSQGKGAIKVFAQALGGREHLAGRVIHYDLERDIALVAFRPNGPVGVAQVVAGGYAPLTGTPVFSIGCNKGDSPTIMQGQVISLGKRYIRPQGEDLLPLLEVSGRPIDGRSGGGLFTADGRLAGVCNFADQEDDRGLYACPATIHTELDRNKLSFVYQRANAGPAANAMVATPPARGMMPPPTMTAPPAMGAAPPPMQAEPSNIPAGWGSPDPLGQVVCIVPSANHPSGKQTLVIERPSPALMEMLARESKFPGANLSGGPMPNGTVVRGQNAP